MFQDSLLYRNQSIIYKMTLQQHPDNCLSREEPYLGQADTQNLTTTPDRGPRFPNASIVFSVSSLRTFKGCPQGSLQSLSACRLYLFFVWPWASPRTHKSPVLHCAASSWAGPGRGGGRPCCGPPCPSMLQPHPSHSPVHPSPPRTPPLSSGTMSQGARWPLLSKTGSETRQAQHEDWKRQWQSRGPGNGEEPRTPGGCG